MIAFRRKKHGPIGIDVGSRSVKMVQLSADRARLIEASRGETSTDGEPTPQHIGETIGHTYQNGNFEGRDAVICLGGPELFLQNLRVPKADPPQMDRAVQQEAAGRVPFAVSEAEIRYLEAADIRQGDAVLREVILMACHRPVLESVLERVEAAGLSPIAVDVEPMALLRTIVAQYRRDADRQSRGMIVHVGHSTTCVVIAQGEDILFIKYIPIGGSNFDQAVARSLKMETAEAALLRRHNGDRRLDRQDPEIARGVSEAIRPVVERLAGELSLCIRYHSVTFRGQPLERVILGGGEATPEFVELFTQRLGVACELSDPFRGFPTGANGRRLGQWDVATGLALREA